MVAKNNIKNTIFFLKKNINAKIVKDIFIQPMKPVLAVRLMNELWKSFIKKILGFGLFMEAKVFEKSDPMKKDFISKEFK